MNVPGPAAAAVPSSSSSPCNSSARHPPSSNVRPLCCAFLSYPQAPPGEWVPLSAPGLKSSFSFCFHRHPRQNSSRKILAVRAGSSAFDSGYLQKKTSKWVFDGREPQKPQEKALKVSESSANNHASSSSSARDIFSPNNQQGAVSPSRTSSTLTRKQHTRDIDPSASSRLQNRLPAFKHAAEPDAFGAAYLPLHGADAFSRFSRQGESRNGASLQGSSTLEKASSPKESLVTSKLEEILNKFRTREKVSSSRDDLIWDRRKGETPSPASQDYMRHNESLEAANSKVHTPRASDDLRNLKKGSQSMKNMGSIHKTPSKVDEEENIFSSADTEQHRRDSLREKRHGVGNRKVGLNYKRDGAPSNPYEGSTQSPWEEQGSPAIESPFRNGSSYSAGMRRVKPSQSSGYDKNQGNTSYGGHRSSSFKKPRERTPKHGGGKYSKSVSLSQKARKSDAENQIFSEFEWTDSDEEDDKLSDKEKDRHIVQSSSLDDGGSSLHGKSDDSSTNATNGSSVPPTVGKIAAWHSHSYPDLPFEFQYSYSETPKARFIRYREAPYSPFGPTSMGRPWTGRAPLKKSTKNLPEFDSFSPPPEKKGIKFVQAPGPFLDGQGPTRAKSREEILGEPLSGEEIVELVDKCQSERRQLNLGRDGVIHNMLDLIHCHWKRRRVVKIKCLGIPTVDMDNVCFHLEDKTGGKIIYRSGGVVYLFRGRNYNYRDRPKIPTMLWKPISPVYPRLIKRAPAGLTVEEAEQLRQLGKKVEPLCTLSKNGVYLNLVKDVKSAFMIDDLVRIDCRGLNPSDYKKIGAKLRDLVPCILLSFDDEQILMWKGKPNPSPGVEVYMPDAVERLNDSVGEAARPSCDAVSAELNASHGAVKEPSDDTEDDCSSSSLESKQQALVIEATRASTEVSDGGISAGAEASMGSSNQFTISQLFRHVTCMEDSAATGHERQGSTPSDSHNNGSKRSIEFDSKVEEKPYEDTIHKTASMASEFSIKQKHRDVGAGKEGVSAAPVVRLDALWDQAIESGMAIQLDETETDSDIIVKKVSALDEVAPTVGAYTLKLQNKLRPRKPKTPRPPDDLRIHFANLHKAKLQKRVAKRAFRQRTVDVPDGGGLPVDELARLLSLK